MHPLAVDHEKLWRCCNNGFEGVLQRPAVFGLCLAKLCNFHHFAFKGVTPLGIQVFILDQRTVGLGISANRPKERGKEGVFAAAVVATYQDGVVDLV